MKFKPMTDKEIAEADLWSIGEYSFEIAKSEDFTSQKGNEMIKLTLNVFNDEGHSRIIFDYLTDAMMYKLKHCCDVCGLQNAYDQGILESIDFEGKTGTLKLGIKKDKSGQYPDSNSVNDYIVNKDAPATPHEKVKSFTRDELDDDIPF